MNKHKILLLAALLTSSNLAFAKGSIGFSADISFDGFFSPELAEFKIKSVAENSAAEKAGIKVGQEVISIDGCKIPSCPAKKAEKLMEREAGDILPLLIKNTDGSEELIEILLE